MGMCTVLTKTPVKDAKSILLRDYTLVKYEIIQPMIDNSQLLQSLCGDQDPELIAQKLVDGVKEITDVIVTKKRVQARSRKYEYWNEDLEKEREEVAALHKLSVETKDTEDIRKHKHAKNRHTKNIKKYQKKKKKKKKKS